MQGGKTQEDVEKAIKNALEGNKQRVKDLSSEKTILFNPNTVPTTSAAPITPRVTSTINNEAIPPSAKEILLSYLDFLVPLPVEGSEFYELNKSTAERRREEILKGKKDDFPRLANGNIADINWYINEIKIRIEKINEVKKEKEKRALQTKGQLSQDEALRGPEAMLGVHRGAIRRYLENAFYLLNQSTQVAETPATINQGNTQTGAAYTAQKEQAINDHDEEFEDEFTLRRAKDTTTLVWNQEKELKWLNKVLPQLSEQDRVKVVKGLIKVGKRGALAWGQFDKGVITLSDIAAEGTAYHEAFHAVFNLLLDNNERQALYDEAKKLYGEKDNLSLEEDMAEGFREYVMIRQNRGLGKRILDFFKELFTKITNWNNFRPSLIYYYRRINGSKYVDSTFKVPTISELRGTTSTITSFNTLSDFMQENLLKKGWTAEKFNSISQEERNQAVKCIAF